MTSVAECLQGFRDGECDGAFHALVEMGLDPIPELIAAFRNERDSEVRTFIVQVAWQRRAPSAIPFLGEALRDEAASVWKEALDGLVTLGSPGALDELRSARTRLFPRQRDTDLFRSWLEEAIEQVESTSA
jgi:hypothetical protein